MNLLAIFSKDDSRIFCETVQPGYCESVMGVEHVIAVCLDDINCYQRDLMALERKNEFELSLFSPGDTPKYGKDLVVEWVVRKSIVLMGFLAPKSHPQGLDLKTLFSEECTGMSVRNLKLHIKALHNAVVESAKEKDSHDYIVKMGNLVALVNFVLQFAPEGAGMETDINGTTRKVTCSGPPQQKRFNVQMDLTVTHSPHLDPDSIRELVETRIEDLIGSSAFNQDGIRQSHLESISLERGHRE